MIIKYTYGISHKGMTFGWKDKQLYRLPQVYNKRFLPLKKLNKIKVGNRKGYRLCGDRFSDIQLKSMTIFINQEFQEIKDKNLPF